ncbi:MATE family efflux transporter [Fusobacterium perfoetens]|uniref:MATE family efflux transporter n=1 Tax=Fusobacterium perfoetens TaxID=852 RepID=UPI000483FB0A|nr:MATE family efflux transporter [Fusobacterium perfoetens]
MNQNFMKERAILPLILSMSLPMMFSMMMASLYNIVDSYFVAKISENAMTALSLVFPIQNLVNAITIGFAIGINAIIAYHLGAKEEKKANIGATQGLFFNGIHGILLTIICILIMPSFLKMFTSDSETINLGIRYSNIVFSFSLIISLGMTFEKIFQSMGKMLITMICMLSGCITNIILDPIMIFGWGIFPKMGIEGAALATGIGQTFSLLLYILFYYTKPIQVKISPKYLILKDKTFIKLYSIGIPAGLNIALPSLLISVLNGILATYSQIYVVILGAYYKLQSFLYLPANGIVQGMRPLIGFNYGAREYERVKKIYNFSLYFAILIMVLGTILCWSIPEILIGMFTTNNNTILAGTIALKIISIGFIISAVSVISSGALEGIGMGGPSLIISLLRYVLLIIPIAFILSRFMEAIGVWHSFWITEFLSAIISHILYVKIILKK